MTHDTYTDAKEIKHKIDNLKDLIRYLSSRQDNWTSVSFTQVFQDLSKEEIELLINFFKLILIKNEAIFKSL